LSLRTIVTRLNLVSLEALKLDILAVAGIHTPTILAVICDM